ncbi:FecR family protein [Reichenbachiella versicolor]|uniref:FecR family protein n=1 Tax=Reichenbachiella versicolor TaxID=1821036 RepID=UPI000D6E1B53|nr:FecR family protein [Reichenbachiella versicolor]
MDKGNIKYDEAFMAEYLAGQMEQSRSAEFEAALKNDIELKIDFELFEKEWQQISLATLVSEDDLTDAWEKQKRRIVRESWRSKLVKVGVAAVLVFGVTLAFLTIRNEVTNSWVTVSADQLDDKKYELPDGSIVYIYPGSTLKYQEDFAQNRNLELNGEAFFDVSRDESHPFVIGLGDAQVKVLGTSFNVASSNKVHSVQVKSGKVAYELEGNKPVLLTKNMNLKVEAGKISMVERSEPNILSWYNKSLSFEDTPLTEVFDVVGHAYQHEFKLESKSFSSCRLTANYEQATLKDIKQAISKIYNLQMKEEGEQTIVTGDPCE